MRTQKPVAWDQVAGAPAQQLLRLALGLKEHAQAMPTPSAMVAMLARDRRRLKFHVSYDPPVQRLALVVVAIIHQQLGNVSDSASGSAEPQLEFVIGRVEKIFVPVASETVINGFAHKQCLMTNVIHCIEQHLVVVTRFPP